MRRISLGDCALRRKRYAMAHHEDTLLALAFDNKEELQDDLYVKLCNICKNARNEREHLRNLRQIAEVAGSSCPTTLRIVRRWHRAHVKDLDAVLKPVLKGIVGIAKSARH